MTDISELLALPVLMETLGSSFAKSATDLLTVGIPSIAFLSRVVPVPILMVPSLLEAVTTTSSTEDELDTKSTETLVVSVNTRYTLPTVSVPYPGALTLTVYGPPTGKNESEKFPLSLAVVVFVAPVGS